MQRQAESTEKAMFTCLWINISKKRKWEIHHLLLSNSFLFHSMQRSFPRMPFLFKDILKNLMPQGSAECKHATEKGQARHRHLGTRKGLKYGLMRTYTLKKKSHPLLITVLYFLFTKELQQNDSSLKALLINNQLNLLTRMWTKKQCEQWYFIWQVTLNSNSIL